MLKAAITKIQTTFAPNVMQDAEYLYQKGHVLNVRLSEGLLKGSVKDPKGALYQVFVDLKQLTLQFRGCQCGQVNCAHVAALFFAFQSESLKPVIPQVSLLSELVEKKNDLMKLETVEWFSKLSPLTGEEAHYTLGILYDGERIDIAPFILSLLSQQNLYDDFKKDDFFKETMLITLPSSKQIAFPLRHIKPYIQFLLQFSARTLKQRALKLSRAEWFLMQEVEQNLKLNKQNQLGLKSWRKYTLSSEETILLDGFQATLRSYQKAGLLWLLSLRRCGVGGILSDDMGLGKTIQTLALLQHEKNSNRLTKPSLVIVPKSLTGNWLKEAASFAPSLSVLVYEGGGRHAFPLENYDVIVVTYGLIGRDLSRFSRFTFYYIILDEAQWIKNAKTQTTRAIYALKAKHRLCLTGTPLENHLGEVWSLFHFLMPQFLGEQVWFRRFFQVPIEKEQNVERNALLSERLRPFMLRRTKDEVEKSLPKKTEVTYTIPLHQKQQVLYETVRLSMEKKVRLAISELGLPKSRMIVLDALLKLRQICCDPRLVSLPGVITCEESSKFEALFSLLETLFSEKRRILLFSQFTSMLDLIATSLTDKKINYLMLTGRTKNRDEIVNTFQKGNTPLLLMSLRAGGTGLNLTAADTVIHYDPWWNPQVQMQASDRIHRIGQLHPVFIYHLITEKTVEEAMIKLQEKKQRLAENIFHGAVGGSFDWTMEDIDAFFSTTL